MSRPTNKTYIFTLALLCGAMAFSSAGSAQKYKIQPITPDQQKEIDDYRRENDAISKALEPHKTISFSKQLSLKDLAKEYPFAQETYKDVLEKEERRHRSIPSYAEVAEDAGSGKQPGIVIIRMQGDYFCSDMMGCAIEAYADTHDGKGYTKAADFLTPNDLRISREGDNVSIYFNSNEGELKYTLKDRLFMIDKNHIEENHEGPIGENPPEVQELEKALHKEKKDSHHK